jgi:hypothetical protein
MDTWASQVYDSDLYGAKAEEKPLSADGYSTTSRKDLRRGERDHKIWELAGREWEISSSERNRVSHSVIREWFRLYDARGCKMLSLFLKDRCDSGQPRSIDAETELVLENLKRELVEVSLPVMDFLFQIRRKCRANCPELDS